jgi:hypothetical protein
MYTYTKHIYKGMVLRGGFSKVHCIGYSISLQIWTNVFQDLEFIIQSLSGMAWSKEYHNFLFSEPHYWGITVPAKIETLFPELPELPDVSEEQLPGKKIKINFSCECWAQLCFFFKPYLIFFVSKIVYLF